MGKGLLRIIGRMLGICVLLAALIYGVQWAEQLPIATDSSLMREILGGLLWILMGFLLPFLTAQKRERLAFSLEGKSTKQIAEDAYRGIGSDSGQTVGTAAFHADYQFACG